MDFIKDKYKSKKRILIDYSKNIFILLFDNLIVTNITWHFNAQKFNSIIF
jgi:hypothetical protein